MLVTTQQATELSGTLGTFVGIDMAHRRGKAPGVCPGLLSMCCGVGQGSVSSSNNGSHGGLHRLR